MKKYIKYDDNYKKIDLFYDAQCRIIKIVKNNEQNVKKRKIR